MASGEEYLAALTEIAEAITALGGSVNRNNEHLGNIERALEEIRLEIKHANDMVKELKL